MYWCISQNRGLRKYIGFRVKHAFLLQFDTNGNRTCMVYCTSSNSGRYCHQSRSNSNDALQNQTVDNISGRKLSVSYANARSIVNKTTKLCLEMNAKQFDVVIFNETHLDNTIEDSIFRKDRHHHKVLYTWELYDVIINFQCVHDLLFLRIMNSKQSELSN